jgi:deoxyribodipyrimidine photo-lyase
LPIPAEPSEPDRLPAGEAEAQRRLKAFVSGRAAPIFGYSESRNRMDADGTSQLSPYLRFGMLSPRHALAAASDRLASAPSAAARGGAETWINELIWREFFNAVLHHFPDVQRHAFRPSARDIVWETSPDAFQAWCEGRTGYPIIDAAMRQLTATGWMHNRARMIVGSFLVKDLLLDWRLGERYFMQQLVDRDPAANNGGWQWVAGTGADAAPYFRIFNPVAQGKKFDPDGAYVRRWVPEVRRVRPAYLHEPWTMDASTQAESGCRIGRDYPSPIVDHAQARARALSRYKRRSN